MRILSIIFRHEWLHLRASNLILLVVGLVLLAGGYAIYYGQTEMARQEQVLSRAKAGEQERIDQLKKQYPRDTLSTPFVRRLFRVADNPPGPWAGLSIGQRDVLPYYMSLRTSSLQGQIYTTEIANPLKLLTGNFDLAFVLIYLFPLLIIALSYNLLSVEQEQGTLALLRSQPVSLSAVIRAKLLFRIMLVGSLLVMLSLIGIVWQDIPWDGRVGAWLAVSGAYCLFWFGLVFLVVSLRRNSAFNAFLLLGAWLLFTIVAPALLSVVVSMTNPIPPRIDLVERIQHELNDPWSEKAEVVLDRFYQKYPQYRIEADTTKNLVPKTGQAMGALADDNLQALAASYEQRVTQREQLLRQWYFISPAVSAQAALNAIAETDLADFQRFMQTIPPFHQQLKAFLFPNFFRNVRVKSADMDQLPTYTPPPPSPPAAVGGAAGLILLTALLAFMAGIWIFRKGHN